MTAHAIKTLLARRFKKARRAVYFELGLNRRGQYRADVLSLSMAGHVIVVEVKSSVADFKSDKKMHNYLDYCNQFYIACQRSVYERIRFDIPGAGVFIVADDLSRIVKVLPAKNRDLADTVHRSLLIRAAFRNADNCTRKNRRA